MLRLVRFSDYSSVKRPHRDDDFVVLADDRDAVARILQIEGGPSDGHWRWSITSERAIKPGIVSFGVSRDLETAKQEFKVRWTAALAAERTRPESQARD